MKFTYLPGYRRLQEAQRDQPRRNPLADPEPAAQQQQPAQRPPTPSNIISLGGVVSSPVQVTGKTQPEFISSYSWRTPHQGDQVPSIFVPGAPRRYTGPTKLPISIKEDENTIINENSYRVPQFPFEPVLQSIAVMKPDFRFDNVDIVCDQHVLSNLLPWAEGQRNDSALVTMNMVGKTLFLFRTPGIAIGPSAGYGHNFEAATTTPLWDVQSMGTHYRVEMYMFGRLNIMVRHEVDAYLDPLPSSSITSIDNYSATTLQPLIDPTPLPHHVPGTGYNVNVQSRHQNATVIFPGGKFVQSSSVAELKSSVISAQTSAKDYMLQLWFSRTRWLIHGEHSGGGIFRWITTTDVKTEFFDNWEARHQDGLRKLSGLLEHLRNYMLRCEVSPPSMVWTGDRYEPMVLDRQRRLVMTAGTRGNIVLHKLPRPELAVPWEMVGRFWGSGPQQQQGLGQPQAQPQAPAQIQAQAPSRPWGQSQGQGADTEEDVESDVSMDLGD